MFAERQKPLSAVWRLVYSSFTLFMAVHSGDRLNHTPEFYILLLMLSVREDDDRGRHAAGDGGGELTFTDARIPHTTGPY